MTAFSRTRRRRAAVFLAAALALVAMRGESAASQLLVPCIGVPDSAMNGATVATPLTPTAAAFSNPAGITALEKGAVSFGLGIPVGHSQLNTTTPPGYDTTSDFVAMAPEGGRIFETEGGIRYGFALYGSLGAQFDSDAEPAAGVPVDFYSSLAITNLALMAAIPVGERLSIGLALNGMYGQSHLRYTQGQPFAYTVRGPGVQAMLGLRYQVTDQVAVGAGFRTPGMLWAWGDEGAAGGNGEDVEIHLDQPAQVFLGLNADVTERLSLGVYARWTDASAFGNAVYRFDGTPAANVSFMRGATDEWRGALGASYALLESLRVMASFGYADSIVPDSYVSPLLIDSKEWKAGGGLSWTIRGWTLDATVGFSPSGARNVSDTEASIFPGRYTIGGEIYMLGLRTTL